MSNLATIVNNILADSGIDDINVVVSTGSYADPAWITSLAWTKITGSPANIVTGTGTAGQVAYWSSASAITGESNLFWDATNDRLGIGTITPNAILTSANTGALTLDSNDGNHTGFGLFIQAPSTINTVNSAIGFGQTSGRKLAAIGMQTYADADQAGLNFYVQTTASGSIASLTEAWRMTNTGIFQSNGLQTIQTSTGNLTLATAAGNGNIVLSPNGTGVVSTLNNVGIGVATTLASSGPILTTTLTNGGSGYVDNTYVDVAATNIVSNGILALFTIVVSGGIVTTATLTWAGVDYRVGDTLTVSNTLLGGTGSGLIITVNTVDSSQLTIAGNEGGDITLYRSDGSLTANDNIGTIKFSGRDSTLKSSGIYAEIAAFAQGGSGGAYLSFLTSLGGGNALTERMRITAAGNIGIGTNTASNRLTVASPAGGSETISGNFRSFGFLYANQSGNPGFRIGYNESSKNAILAGVEQASGNGGGVEVWSFNGTAWAERMRINAAGNLLVGTTTDNGARLQVSGTATFSSSVTAGRFISSTLSSYTNDFLSLNIGAVGQTIGLRFGYDGSTYNKGAVYFISKSANGVGDLIFALNNSETSANVSTSDERMRITSTGNVGIGVSTVNSKLEIGGEASPIIRITSTSGPYSQIQSNTGGVLQLMADEGNTGANTSIRFRVDGAENMRLTGGNLAIGTINATGQSADNRVIQIYGAGTANRAQIHFANVNTGETETDGSFIGIDSTSELFIINRENAATVFENNGTQTLRITASGVIGFNGSSAIGNAGLDKMSMGYLNSNYGWIQTWNSTPLVLNASGNNVLIGTTTSTGAKLEVNGDVVASNYRTTSGSLSVPSATYTTVFTFNNSDNMAGVFTVRFAFTNASTICFFTKTFDGGNTKLTVGSKTSRDDSDVISVSENAIQVYHNTGVAVTAFWSFTRTL